MDLGGDHCLDTSLGDGSTRDLQHLAVHRVLPPTTETDNAPEYRQSLWEVACPWTEHLHSHYQHDGLSGATAVSELACPALFDVGTEAKRSTHMLVALHLPCKEFHLPLVCSLGSLLVHEARHSWECGWPGWEHSLRDHFLHFAHPCVYPNFLTISCEMLTHRCTGRSSNGWNCGSSWSKVGQGTSGKTSRRTPDGAQGEALVQSPPR